MNQRFDAKELALTQELQEEIFAAQAKRAATETSKRRKKRRRDFVLTTRAQCELLMTARHAATLKIFLYLQFLIFRSRTKTVQLANVALATKSKITPKTKRKALTELERLGLIRIIRHRRRAPEIAILELAEDPST
jgi:hypothetical protein